MNMLDVDSGARATMTALCQTRRSARGDGLLLYVNYKNLGQGPSGKKFHAHNLANIDKGNFTRQEPTNL